jgi:hypothetical protein
MQRHRTRPPLVAAALLVAATILFVVGTTIERSQATSAELQEASPVEQSAGEAVEHREAEETETKASPTGEAGEEQASEGEAGEELLGINPESAGLTAIVALLSLVLAGLLVARPSRGLLVAVAVVGLVFAALDAREAVHQANESNGGLLVLAALTGLLHLGVAVAATAGLRSPTTMTTAA